MELLQKLDHGVFVRCVTEECGVGATIIYDLKKQKHFFHNFINYSI